MKSLGTAVAVPRIPDLMAMYWDDFDTLGHAEGPRSPGMPGLVAEVDHQIGRLVEAAHDVGIYDRTAFILVSDHGMMRRADPARPSP